MKRTTASWGSNRCAFGLTLTSVGTAAVSTVALALPPRIGLTPTQEQCLTDALTGLPRRESGMHIGSPQTASRCLAAYRSSLAQAVDVRDSTSRCDESESESPRLATKRLRTVCAAPCVRLDGRRSGTECGISGRAAYRQDRKVCLIHRQPAER